MALLNHLQDAVFAIENGRFVFVNNQTCQLIGYSREELLESPFTDFIYPQDRDLVYERYQARQKGEGAPEQYNFRIVNKAGDIRDVKMRVGTAMEEEGIITTLGSLQDITEYKRTKRELQHTQEDISSILDNMSDVFYRTDMNGIITMISKSSSESIGYTPDEMVGRPLSDFYCDPGDRKKILKLFHDAHGRAIQVESRLRHKSGQPIWVSTNAYLRLDDYNNPLCIEGIARNVTEKKSMEERLKELARLDDLTHLFNRRYFLQEAHKQFAIASRYGRELSVMMLDLDLFKNINDTYGHDFGDRALSHFASQLTQVFRDADLVGRLGGEEFVVLLPETDVTQSMELGKRLRRILANEPIVDAKNNITLTFSAGIATMNSDDNDFEGLLKRADKLLYQAKERGRDRIEIDIS